MVNAPVCRVCHDGELEPIYSSGSRPSLTTLCQVYDRPTEVSFCGRCGHLQTQEIVDIEDYYAHQYAILAETPEEDQLYRVADGKPVFQVDHRVATLLRHVTVPRGARVLDYGCAKGSVLKRLAEQRPDITPYFFDVTQRYLPFWREWAEPSQWTTGSLPPEWSGQFDLVCSFYVLEHVADPVTTVTQLASLLKPGGILYFLVPNVLANTADLIVADHLHHYSPQSLLHVLVRSGLETVTVDDHSHHAAYIAVARRSAAERGDASLALISELELPDLRARYQAMSSFWTGLAGRVEAFEEQHRGRRGVCIYGAGFYGNFLASCLREPAAVTCFVDQNPHLHGRTLQGKPIIAPSELGMDVTLMYIGLNPAVARSVIRGIQCWSNRRFETFYL